MSNHEIVIRIVIEQAGAKSVAAAPGRIANGHKQMDKSFYHELVELPVGGQKDITENCKSVGASVPQMKKRIQAYMHYLRKHERPSAAFVVAKGWGGVIMATRTA